MAKGPQPGLCNFGNGMTPEQFEEFMTEIYPHYSTVPTVPIVIDYNTFQDVATLSMDADTPAGTYLALMSITVSNPDTNDSFFFQFTGDFATTQPFSIEGKDVTDTVPYSFVTEVEHTGGAWTTTLQVRKEDANANDITIGFLILAIKRVA